MFIPKNQQGFRQILTSDVRFARPTVTDDQVWSLVVDPDRPLSISTTYGLRAKRMLVFPEFTSGNLSISNPLQFEKFPQVTFHSTNFSEIEFSPFLSLDAQLKIWVPSSQMITGQITVSNTSDISHLLHVDWLVQLDPLPGGQAMTSARMGSNTILQGKTGDLFPVFYLTGGPEESSSVYPGLSIKLLLVPGATRQVTWVLATQSSTDASFHQARYYASRQMEVEKFKIEMADKHQKCFFESSQQNLADSLNQSQNRAYQLLMPVVRQFKNSTFIQSRDPDRGIYPKEEMLEIAPEWSGQTLPDTWLMAQNLLPGRPETVKGLIQNTIDAQETNGWIDYRVSANHKSSGHLALPMLAALACEVHRCSDDLGWLENIYPRLVQFFKCWFSPETNTHQQLTHPVQVEFLNPPLFEQDQISQVWAKLKTSENPLLLSLLYRECKSLIQIASWLKSSQDMGWLDDIQNQLASQAERLWNEGLGIYQYRDVSSGLTSNGKVLCEFKQDGKHKPERKITAPGRLLIRLNPGTRISPDFCCILSGTGSENKIETTLFHQSFEWIDTIGISVPAQSFLSLDSIEIRNWKKGDIGQVVQADLTQRDITSLLPLWAGIPSPEQAEKMLAPDNIEPFLGANGISFYPSGKEVRAERITNTLAAMIIEGLLLYHRPDLADRFFRHHFDPDSRAKQKDAGLESSLVGANLFSLLPVKCFLAVLGVKKFTPHEVIVTHFNRNPHPVTVQYNQTKLTLKSDQTKIIARSGETIILDQPQPHRVVFE